MSKSNKKVLLVCPYTYPSACGIWARVYSDAKALRDSGYEVHIFSTNIIKGTKYRSVRREIYDRLHIRRFHVLLNLGQNAFFWPQATLSILKLRPKIIHTHGYRHPHSLFSLIIGKLIGSKVILTTHAPFDKDPREAIHLKLFDFFYDLLIGWWQLKLFDKVIRISNWEEPSLEKLGYKKAILIPNPINPIFLKSSEHQRKDPKRQLLYMGRIDPVKRLEWVRETALKLPDLKFRIHGPIQGYENFYSSSPNLEVINKPFTPEEYIDELQNSDIFLLPSIRESFGIVALEAMAQGNILIASDSKGPREYIKNHENGFLVKNEDEMVNRIEYIYKNWDKMDGLIKKSINTASQYSADKVNKLLLELYSELTN